MKNNILFVFLLFLTFFSILPFVNAEMLISDVGVKYNSEILEGFESSEVVHVLVDLKDMSNTSAPNVEERDAWFKPKIDEVLATLSTNEFNLVRKSSTGFRGEITEKGFNVHISKSWLFIKNDSEG